jgi:hypothetical protein
MNGYSGAASGIRVLLGDGSIKGASYDWDGGGEDSSWTTPANWAADQVPSSGDRVRIDAARVEVTQSPAEVWSIDLRRGADLSLSGAGTRLASQTSLVADDPTENSLYMGPRTLLLLGAQGSLCNLNVTMDGTTDDTTYLSAGRLMDNCTGVTVGSNCQLDAAKLICSSFSPISPIKGTVNVGLLLYCPLVTLGQGGLLRAGEIDTCSIDLPVGTVVVGLAAGSVFNVGQGGSIAADTISDCTVTVQGGTVTVNNDVGGGAFDVTEGAVTVFGAVGIGDWSLSASQLTAGPTVANGEWTLSAGSTASLECLSTTQMGPLILNLSDGAQLTIGHVPATQPTLCNDTHHRISAGDGASRLVSGGGAGEELYAGNRTTIYAPPLPPPSPGEEDLARLSLELSAGLSIASDFEEPEVYQLWDTKGVDVTLEPIPASQSLELITRPVMPLFIDVPCEGGFRDLIIPAATASCGPVVVANAWINQTGDNVESGNLPQHHDWRGSPGRFQQSALRAHPLLGRPGCGC